MRVKFVKTISHFDDKGLSAHLIVLKDYVMMKRGHDNHQKCPRNNSALRAVSHFCALLAIAARTAVCDDSTGGELQGGDGARCAAILKIFLMRSFRLQSYPQARAPSTGKWYWYSAN